MGSEAGVIKFQNDICEINKQLERSLVRKLPTRIVLRASEVADKNLQLEAVGHRTLLSYVQNDLKIGTTGHGAPGVILNDNGPG
jgi:hypothetical protein